MGSEKEKERKREREKNKQKKKAYLRITSILPKSARIGRIMRKRPQ